MTIAPLKLGFSAKEFAAYCNKIGKVDWRPQGIVYHNTAMPTLAMVQDYLAGTNANGKNPKKLRLTPAQLIENWWQSYINQGWFGGPHVFIFPKSIYVANPLTQHGTHSPSFNAFSAANKTKRPYFGIEIVGNYDAEKLPIEMRDLAASTGASLLRLAKREANSDTVKFHGEDPLTTHKHCPGKNIGTKAQWVEFVKTKKE